MKKKHKALIKDLLNEQARAFRDACDMRRRLTAVESKLEDFRMRFDEVAPKFPAPDCKDIRESIKRWSQK